MANELIRIDSSGLSVSSFDVAKEAFERDVVEAFGGDIDDHAHTPQEQFASINASVWAEMNEEILRACLYGADLDVAPGKFLDALGTLLDIKRRPATKSSVVCQVSGVAGTTIPKGSIVQDTLNNRYESDNDTVLPAFGATIDMPCTALEYGAIAILPSTVNRIISVINGWERVDNAEPGVAGTDRESDTEYRANLKARTTINASSTLGALGSALDAAGAEKYKIIENPTTVAAVQGGVSVPPHSIVIAVSGGLSDDIARAVINNRGMGVNIYTAIEGRQDYSPTDLALMDAARFKFNDEEYTAIDLSGAANGDEVATILNNYPSAPAQYPHFSAAGNRLLSFFDWRDEVSGFADSDGSLSSGTPTTVGFNVVSAKQYGRRIRIEFDAEVGRVEASSGNNAPFAVVTSTTQSTNDTINGATTIRGNTIEFLASADFTTVENRIITFFMQNSSSNANVFSLDEIPASTSVLVDQIATDDDSNPVEVIAWALPDNASATVYMSAFVPTSVAGKQIAKWQYRRYDGTEYVTGDNNWRDINNSNTYLNTGLGGFDNSKTDARIEVRAVNVDGDFTIAYTQLFTTNGDVPTFVVADSYIDGKAISLHTSRPLLARTRTTNLTNWTVRWKNAARTVVAEYARGDVVTLIMSDAIDAGESITVNYSRPSQNNRRITSSTGRYVATTTSPLSITNRTIAGVPASPAYVRSYKTQRGFAGTTIEWVANDDGGTAIDRYEYRTRTTNDVNWGVWNAITNPNLRKFSFGTDADEVQMRASNPNIRFVEVFGLGGRTEPPPYLRSVPYQLKIGIELNNTGTLTGDILLTIRRSIVEFINGYDMGSKIWANDIFALVERIAGTEVNFNSADTYVTYNGIAVNASNAPSVPVYAEWSVSERDISILFVN